MDRALSRCLRSLISATCALATTSCVPLSVEEYSGGRGVEGGVDPSDAAEREPEASSRQDGGPLDAGKYLDASTSLGTDASSAIVKDTSVVQVPPGSPSRDADVSTPTDAQADAEPTLSKPDAAPQVPTPLDCASPDVLCENFEDALLACPVVAPSRWTSCEQLGSAPQAFVLPGEPPRSRSLMSAVGPGPATRSARVSRELRRDLGELRAEFDFLPQPSTNKLYTVFKLEQEAGRDANGIATYYLGVSLVVSDGYLLVDVQTADDLISLPQEAAIAVRQVPRAWTHVNIKIVYAEQITVTLGFDDEPPRSLAPFARGLVPIDRMFALFGVYTDLEGDASVLYDNLVMESLASGGTR
jgi:hypothetical protein